MKEREIVVKDRGDITTRQLFGGMLATAALLGGGFLWGNRVQEQRDQKKYGITSPNAGPTPTSILSGSPENTIITIASLPPTTVATSTHTEYVNVACDGPTVTGSVKDADYLDKYKTYSVLKAMDRTAKEADPAAPDFYSNITPGEVAKAFAVEVLTRSGVTVNFDIDNTPKDTPFTVATTCHQK